MTDNEMTNSEIQHSTTRTLAQVMGLFETRTTPGWSDDELASMVDHQLTAPLSFDLSRLQGVDKKQVLDLALNDNSLIVTFCDLLTHPKPPVALLSMVKEYAKASMDHPASPLPRPIASVFYYAAIAAAQVRLNQTLTQLDHPALRQGLKWALNQPWLGQTLQSLLTTALQSLDETESTPSPPPQ